MTPLDPPCGAAPRSAITYDAAMGRHHPFAAASIPDGGLS